jgi:predicted AlkP superfamily phosphohydrolase/phosphomutase
MGRLIIIGLDGASLGLVRAWAAEGHLPTLAGLLKHGASGPLRSTIPPYTAQAWTTMVTGVNAGRHRLFDFWERDLETYGFRLTNAGFRAAPALWTVLSQRERRVVVVNVPMTFPPEPVNGVLVSGWDTPGLGSAFTHPPDVREELPQALGRPYVIVPGDWRWMRQRRPERARAELLDEVTVRFAAVRHLLRTREWDMGMFVVGATDGAAHFFWQLHDPTHPAHDPTLAARLGDVLLQVYRCVDEQLGLLLDEIGDVPLLIVSDHGSGRRELRAIHLNLWLACHGWLHFAAAGHNGQRWITAAVTRLKDAAYTLLPHQQLNRLRRLWPDRWRGRLSRHELFAGVDWARTRAFSEERRGNIWINLRGREPQGIVAPGAEYEALRDDIAAALEGVRDSASGEPLVKRVWRREELFDGPYADRIPDLLAEIESPAQFIVHRGKRDAPPVRPLTEQEIADLVITGDHRMEGMLLVAGPGVQPGAALSAVHLCDVFPTALYLMGEEIPAPLDGQVVEQAFQPAWLRHHPPRHREGEEAATSTPEHDYSAQEAQEIVERLAGLGYLG